MLTVRARILLLIVAMGLSFGLVASIWLWWQLDQIFDRESHARFRAITQALSQTNVGYIVAGDKDAAQAALWEAKARDAAIEYIYLVDFTGRVFAHTFAGGFPAALLDLRLTDEADEGRGLFHLKTDRGTIHHSARPVIWGSRARLHVGISEAALHATLDRSLAYVVLMTVGIALVGCVIGILVSRRITSPIEELAQLMATYGRGEALDDSSVLALRTGGQELVSLRRAFREMIETRERAESLRGQSEVALAEAQRLAHVGNWRWSIERSELVSCSEEYARIHGVGPDEIHALMKQQMERVVHPEDRDRVTEAFRGADEEGCDYEIEYRIVRPDGEVRHVQEIGEAVPNAFGQAVEYLGSLQDITERKRSEQALRHSLTHLRHAQKIAKLDYWVWDPKNQRSILPGEESTVIGISPDELRGLADEARVERYVHPDDRERVLQAYGPPPARNRNIDVEYRLVRPDGEVRIIREVGESVLDGNGEIVSQIGTLQDVTEQRATDERFRRYFDLPLVGSAIYTPDKRWVRVNDKLCDLFGYSREELLHRTWADLTHPDDLARNLQLFDEAMAGERDTYSMDKRFVRKNGEIIHTSISVQCLRLPDGTPDYFILLVQDLTVRKRAEEALRRSEANLASSQRIAGLGSYEWDFASGQLTWSDETYRIFGQSSQEFEPTVEGFLELVHPDDRSTALSAVGAALEACRSYDVTFRIVRPDGGERTLHDLGEPDYDPAGKPIRIRGAVHDVTESKRAEDALRKSEAGLANAQRIARLGNWEWDAKTGDLSCSDETYRIFGLEPQALNRPVTDFLEMVHSEDRERVREVWRRGLEDRIPMDVIHRVVRGDGAVRFVHQRSEATYDDDGEPTGVAGTLLDITETKLVEDALRRSEERFRGLFEKGAIGLAQVATDGRFLQVNPAYCEFTGYASSALIGNRFDMVIHPDDLKAAAEHRQSVLDGKPVSPMHERRYRHKSGEERWGLAGVAPMLDPDGGLEGYIVQVQDITERKRIEGEVRKFNEELELRVEARTAELRAAQEELVRKERLAALGQLTGTVSHELRNPLGAMRTSLAAIRKLSRDGDPMLKRSVEIVDNSVTRCDNIIGDLLDFSRVRNLALEPTAVDGWLERLLDEYRVPPGITLRRDLEAGAKLAFDRNRLRQVMINLLDNACQAMAGEGDVVQENEEHLLTVATRRTDGRAEISIADTGPGISSDQADKIFEPLYSSKAFGVGLGLPIVKQIVEQHGGGIELDGGAGSGARFVIRLPLPVPVPVSARRADSRDRTKSSSRTATEAPPTAVRRIGAD